MNTTDRRSATRLSTALDSVTLYGEDPDVRCEIWGKVGEAGVSICTVEDVGEGVGHRCPYLDL